MTDRPIIFSAPMVRALVDGRKTQTRRLMTPGTCTVLGSGVTGKSAAWAGLKFDRAEARTKCPASGALRPHLAVPWVHPDDEARGMAADAIYRVDPIIEVGDRLYVREAWSHDGPDIETVRSRHEDALGGGVGYGPYYRATETAPDTLSWRPSIHMPRWASRLTLMVTEVRVERLQDISEDDAADEGVVLTDMNWPTYRTNFAELWRSIHGPDAWAANPWVAAISFSVHRANIDALSEVAA